MALCATTAAFCSPVTIPLSLLSCVLFSQDEATRHQQNHPFDWETDGQKLAIGKFMFASLTYFPGSQSQFLRRTRHLGILAANCGCLSI